MRYLLVCLVLLALSGCEQADELVGCKVYKSPSWCEKYEARHPTPPPPITNEQIIETLWDLERDVSDLRAEVRQTCG